MNRFLKSAGIGLATFVVTLLIPSGADALTISPPLIDHQLNPGDTVLETLKIYNEDQFDITVYPLLRNFTSSDDESGEPKFLPPDEEDNGTGLAKWVTLDDSPITIKAQERTNLSLAINVPADAQPGGHYGAVLLSTEPPSARPGIGVSQQLGALFLIRISGDVIEDARIADFGFVNKRVWYNHLPIDMELRFENSGNTHLRPAGNVFIKNWMGRQVKSIEINPQYRGVLPRSVRKFNFGWSKGNVNANDSGLKQEWDHFGFGKYEATLVIYYGNDNKMVTAVREFTVWPWRLMILGGVILIILILGFWLYGRTYKKRLMKKLEKAAARRSGGASVSEKEMRLKMEKDMREKLEAEYKAKMEDELKRKGGGGTDLPNELKED